MQQQHLCRLIFLKAGFYSLSSEQRSYSLALEVTIKLGVDGIRGDLTSCIDEYSSFELSTITLYSLIVLMRAFELDWCEVWDS